MAVTQNKIVYPQAQKTAQAVATSAKTDYTSSSFVVFLLDAGADGSVVTKLTAIPRATVTATQLQLYISRDGGDTFTFLNSATMAAYTMAQTTAVTPTDFGYTAAAPLRLASGNSLYVAIGVALAGGIVFNAEYQDY